MINDFEKEEKLKNTAEEISKIIEDNNQTCVYLMEQTINIFGT
jgi:hypothetical protein